MTLSNSNSGVDEDLSDLELIQHINVDVHRLIKLLSGKYDIHINIEVHILIKLLW